jgi:phosphatidyl-myo-inositol dimannoside synthase
MKKMMPKTVVLLVTMWRRTGGLEAVTMDVATTFRNLGWRVKVLSVFDDKEPERTEGIEVTSLCPQGRLRRSLWSRLLWKRVAARHLRRALAEGGLLLCAHAHLLPALNYVPRRFNIRRWAWVHGIEVWGAQARRWAPLLNRLDRVVAVSNFTEGELVRAGLRIPISVVPNCVDVEVFTPTSTPDLIRRSEILICGRMAAQERHKGHETLFQSLPIAERLLGRPLSLRVIGTGDDQTRLENVAQQLGIGERVKFVGWASMQELVEAYRHCGVFCMPSRLDKSDYGYWMGEGFGIVYIEAASCGRPVIVSAEGGSPETIIPHTTGLLVDPSSPDAVAHAIVEVLSDPLHADEMGRQGRSLVESRFSRSQILRNLQDMILIDIGSGNEESSAKDLM